MNSVSSLRSGLSEDVESKLVENSVGQVNVLVFGAIVLATVAVTALARTHQIWYAGWGAVGMAVLVFRLGIVHAFHRRSTRGGRHRRWQTWFIGSTWLNGMVVGAGAAATVLLADPFTQMLVLTLLTAHVMGGAARQAVLPASAIGAIVLAEGPLVVACFLTRNFYFTIYAVFAAAFSVSAITVAKNLYLQTTGFLIADEKNVELNRDLEQANARLERMVRIDGLTGIANRRRFEEAFASEVARRARDGGRLSVLMIDVDSFKAYNDHYGHQAGDECLRRVAAAAATCIARPADVLARYGGEEFVAMLPDTDSRGAAQLAENVRRAVELTQLENAAAVPPWVTVSIGVATSRGETAQHRADGSLIERADRALYVAKKSGRNRVEIAEIADLPLVT